MFKNTLDFFIKNHSITPLVETPDPPIAASRSLTVSFVWCANTNTHYHQRSRKETRVMKSFPGSPDFAKGRTLPDVPQTVAEFNKLCDGLIAEYEGLESINIWAFGSRIHTESGMHATTRYPLLNGGEKKNLRSAALIMRILDIIPVGVVSIELTLDHIITILYYYQVFEDDGQKHGNIEILKRMQEYYFLHVDDIRDGKKDLRSLVATFIFDNIAPIGIDDGTLRLYAISRGLYRPNILSTDGLLGSILPDVIYLPDGRIIDDSGVDEALLDAAFGDGIYIPVLSIGCRSSSIPSG